MQSNHLFLQVLPLLVSTGVKVNGLYDSHAHNPATYSAFDPTQSKLDIMNFDLLYFSSLQGPAHRVKFQQIYLSGICQSGGQV